ncbi:MAG: LLM class F420-dependent oxidoreductase [Steroidobacteraceae bacterium]
MKLGLALGYSGSKLTLDIDLIRAVEAAGFDSVWTAEAYGSDAVSPCAWILAQTTRIRCGTAIMQMSARTPSMTAMTAMTLDVLSGGRFILGVGPSGPQVIEGWYGELYGKPLTRTREYIAIIRQILKREAPLEFHGEYYDIPNTGPGSTGLGKPLKSILHCNPDIPIYTGTIAPAGVRTAAEVADGMFPVFMNPERFGLFAEPLAQGFAKSTRGNALGRFEIAPLVQICIDDDLEKARLPVKQMLGLYIGGMGARGKNFYNDYAKRLGYEAEAVKIQDLFLAGKREEAVRAVPDRLVDELALVGPRARIRERLDAWKQAGREHHVTAMLLMSGDLAALRFVAEHID